MIENIGHIKTSGPYKSPTGKSANAAESRERINALFTCEHYANHGNAKPERVKMVLLCADTFNRLQRERGLTNRSLAKLAGVSDSPLSYIRRGRAVYEEIALLICSALEVDLDELELVR